MWLHLQNNMLREEDQNKQVLIMRLSLYKIPKQIKLTYDDRHKKKMVAFGGWELTGRGQRELSKVMVVFRILIMVVVA